MPNVFVIGGCNGAGKTTASLAILPTLLNCQEFVNADAIAAGLSPLNPDSVAVMAGRMMLETIRRRYDRGRRNLVDLYLPIADRWAIFDNTTQPSQPIAESGDNQSSIVYDPRKWAFIQGDL